MLQGSHEIGGMVYTVNQAMVRRARQPVLVRRALGLMAIIIGTPIFAVVGPIWYVIMLNKSISQRAIAHVLPRVMPMMDKAFVSVKKELLKGISGRVLDVGCGDGAWLKYFGKAQHVTELEPNPFLIPRIEANATLFRQNNPNVEVEVVNKFAHELDASKPFDYVVFGNVMCEVPDQAAFLRDIDRVLKPGGKIVFQEHIRDHEGTLTGRFQDIFNHWWCVASDGCNCDRRTVDVMRRMKNWKVTAWELDSDGPPHVAKMAVGIIEKVAAVESESTVSRM